MLETGTRSGTSAHEQRTACGSGMFLSSETDDASGETQQTVKIDESMNCWNICAFVEDLVYDTCAKDASPVNCMSSALKTNSLIPDAYKASCSYSSPETTSPRFWDAEPDSQFCLDKGMYAWLSSTSWDEFVSKKPKECLYPKQDPTTQEPPPTAYVNDAMSGFGEALGSLTPVEFYVVVRGAEEAMKNPVEYGAYLASSIVPKDYWEQAAADAKEGWLVARAFAVPDNLSDFAMLTTAEDGTSTSAHICLYAVVETSNYSDGTRKTFTNYGMIAQSNTCEGQIGVLPVADIRGSGIFDSSAQEISRKTGFNLCVARRWVTSQSEDNGVQVTSQRPMFHVGLDAPCASFVAAYSYTDQVPAHGGQWEQYFVAKTYPLTRGIYGLPDSARCPWASAVQYGLKCYASVEEDLFMYIGSFAEAQLTCRRLVSDLRVPSDFSRVAVMQSDDDAKIMNFLSEPDTFSWVGLFQGTQALLPVKSASLDSSRLPEQSCPAAVLEEEQSAHRHSDIEQKCLKAGADISSPPWTTTWVGLDGSAKIAPYVRSSWHAGREAGQDGIEGLMGGGRGRGTLGSLCQRLSPDTAGVDFVRRWDIKWCSGHPQTEKDNRYVDCAGLRVFDDMQACIESAPCDEANPVFCTYPVDYGPYLVATSANAEGSGGTLRLPPSVRCRLGEACVLQFSLTQPGTSSETTLPGSSGTIWGLPPEGGFVAIKASCAAVDGAMLGPVAISSEVDLASLAGFSSASVGLYELCYCNANAPVVTQAANGVAVNTRCSHESEFNQMVASLALAINSESVGFRQAVELPARAVSVSTRAVLSLVGREAWGGVPTLFCGWEGATKSCPFEVHVTSNGSWKSRPFTTKLRFVPAANDDPSTSWCSADASEISVSVTVEAGDSAKAVFPGESATALFYAVCEGKKFIGYVVLKEVIKAVSAAVALDSVQLSVQSTVTDDDVTLVLRGEFTNNLLLRSKVVAVSVDSLTDTDCSSGSLANLPESSVTIVPFPALSAATDYLIELHFKAGPSAKKLCWIESVALGDSRPSHNFSTYLTTFPRASDVQTLSLEDSRCFVAPGDQPCSFRVTAEPLPSEENPINASPYLPSTFRVYVMEEACPSNSQDPVFDEIDNASYDESAGANMKGFPLELQGESDASLRALLQQRFFPWLQARGSAHFCWVYTRGDAAAACPNDSPPCGGSLGKIYAVGAVADDASNVLVCLPDDPEPCLATVNGVNLNLYETASNRMAALERCGSDTGIGLLTPWGPYSPLVSSSLSAVEIRVLQAQSGSRLASQARPASSGLHDQPSMGRGSDLKAAAQAHAFQGSDGRGELQRSIWSFVADGDVTDPSAGVPAANSTRLVFQVPFSSEGAGFDLCFRSGESDSEDLTRFTETVGHVLFAWRLYSATLDAEITSNPMALWYRVDALSGIDLAHTYASVVVYLKPVDGYPADTAVPCDYEQDTSGDAALQIQGPVQPFEATGESVPGEPSLEGTLGSFKLQVTHTKTMAVCWSQLLQKASQPNGSTSKNPISAQSATLLGYVAGPSLPDTGDAPAVAVSCALATSQCRVTVVPVPATVPYTGGLAPAVPAFLDVAVTVLLDTELNQAPCPEPTDPAYNEARRATSKTRRVLPGDVLTPERQTFLIDSAAGELLKSTGKAGICYRIDRCAAESDASTSKCTQFLGLALWVGPTVETPERVTVCKTEDRQCVFDIDGLNMDAVDYSTARAAYSTACGGPGEYVYAKVKNSGATSTRDTNSDAVPDEVPQQGTALSAKTFAVDIQPASLWKLCWNPFEASGLEVEELDEDRFVVSRGFLVFPARPTVASRRVEQDSQGQAALDLVVSAMVTEAALEQISGPDAPVTQHSIYVSPLESVSDGASEDVACADSDQETEIHWSSVEPSTPTTSGAQASDIHYSILRVSIERKVCWKSIFRDATGKVIYEERIYLTTVPAVLAPELDNTVATQPEADLVLCSLGDEEMCLVTLKPKASTDPTDTATFAPGGELYVVNGFDCPSVRSDPRFQNAAADVPTTAAEAVLLHVVTSEASKKTLSFPLDDRTWMSSRQAAVLCYIFDSSQCTMPDGCVEKIGAMFWRGPRISEDTQLRIFCNDSQGCDINVTGLNLNTFDLSYSRVAALDACGKPGGLGRLEIVTYPDGYVQASPVEPLEDYFSADDRLEQGAFAVNRMGRGLLTCGASETVSVKTASWGLANRQPTAVTCAPLDVAAQVAAHCKGKHICVMYPHSPEDDAAVESYTGLNRDEFLRLDDPCPESGRDTLTLVGTHECVPGDSRAESAALVEMSSRALEGADSVHPSTKPMQMSLKLPPDVAKLYELCWNPDQVITLQPTRYSVKLGVAQIVPTAGMVDLISTVFKRIDDANVEVGVKGILSEEAAVQTSIYLKDIPKNGAISCSNDDPDEAIAKSTYMSYESGDSGTAVILYRIAAVNTEKAVCWRWASDEFASDGGGLQSIFVGTLPGAVNPRPRDWGEMMCGLPGGAECSIEFEPDKLLNTYPAEPQVDDPGAVTGFTDYSRFTNLHGHLQSAALVGLIAGRETCPDDRQDLAYQRFSQTANVGEDLPDSAIQETTLGLPISGGGPAALASTLSTGHLHWLAVHRDAVVCWVNERDCTTDQAPRIVKCTATVGTLSWKGPVPTAWSASLLQLMCRTGAPCRLKIPGHNLFKLDLSQSPVAVVRTCGGDDGPGIAQIEQTPTLYPGGEAAQSEESGALLQTSMSLSSKRRRTVRQFGRSGKRGGRKHADKCDARSSTGKTTVGLVARDRGHFSALEALTGSWRTPSSSVDDTLEVLTTIKSGGAYAICWNPSASSTSLADFTIKVGEVFSYGVEAINALCYSGSYCEVNFTYIGNSNPTLFIGVKAVDCSDPDLTTELGSGGVFRNTKRNTIILSEPIPSRPESSRVSYKLCWCDATDVKDCVGTAYTVPVGTLSVQFVEEKAVACQESFGPCRISFDASDFDGDASGGMFLTEYSGTDADCTQSRRYIPDVVEEAGKLVVQVNQENLATALGHAADNGAFAICRQIKGAVPEDTEGPPASDHDGGNSATPGSEQNAGGNNEEQGSHQSGGGAPEQESPPAAGEDRADSDAGHGTGEDTTGNGAPGVGDAADKGSENGVGGDAAGPGAEPSGQADPTASQSTNLEAKAPTSALVQLDGSADSGGSQQVTLSPARLGVLQFAGPLGAERQDATQAAVLGKPTRITVTTQGFSRFIGTDVTVSRPDMPASLANVRLVPTGGCGRDNGSNTVPLTLSDVTNGARDITENAVYEQGSILHVNVGSLRQLDVCWCNLETACNDDADFSVPVVTVALVAPQQDLAVECACGSRCPFEFEGVAADPKHDLEPDYFVREDECSVRPAGLPDTGHLITVDMASARAKGVGGGSETDSDQSSAGTPATSNTQIKAFKEVVSRSPLFPSELELKSKAFSICYCASKSGGCATDALIKIGTLTIYDVWMGPMTAILADDVTITPPKPPFHGVQGTVYADAGELRLPVKADSDMAYAVDLSPLGNEESPASVVAVHYCESEVTQGCEAAGAPRIDLTQIVLRGPASPSVEVECVLGQKCAVFTKVFNPAEEDRLAALESCGSSTGRNYGISNGVTPGAKDLAKAVDVTFGWEETLPDIGRADLDLCWCKKTDEVDCSTVSQYTFKVGTLNISGLAAGQEVTCHVGAVCDAHLQGYRLREDVTNVRVVSGACGTGGEVSGLPNGGVLEPQEVDASSAHVTSKQPFFGMAPEAAAICQCPLPSSSCTSPADFAWNAGTFTFEGPSERVVSYAFSGNAVNVELEWRGEQQAASDFFILTQDTKCTGQTSGLIDGFRQNGLGRLNNAHVSWETFPYKGGIHSVCYCRRSTPLQNGASDPFRAEGGSTAQHLCSTVAEYRVPVAVVLVTGPVTSSAVFACFVGAECLIDISVAGLDSSDNQDFLKSATVYVTQESCDAEAAMEATLSKAYGASGTLDDASANVQMKTFNQTFRFTTAVSIAAGYYVACWKPASASSAILLGDFVVKGPLVEEAAWESSSGQDVDVGLTYAGLEGSKEASEMRIRVYPIPAGEEKDTFNCAAPDPTESRPYLRFTNLDRAPDAVESVSMQFSRIVWRSVSIVIDDKTPDLTPGAYFAVCFCNGNRGDCAEARSYFFQLNTWVVGGLSQRTVEESVPVGRTVTLTLSGKRLPLRNHLMMLSQTDPTTLAERHCGDDVSPQDVQIVSATRPTHVTDWVAFKDFTVASSTRTTLLCWCGGDACETGNMFRTFVGKVSVEYPTFEATTAVIGGTFSITLRGSMLRSLDAITVVDQHTQCGAEGTDAMDASVVEVPAGLPFADLATLRTARVVHADSASSGSLTAASDATSLFWQSWPIKTKASVSGHLRVCYCSSEEGVCSGAGRFSIWVGSVQVRGPSTGDVDVVQVEGQQKIEATGVGLALTDKLKIFPRSLAVADSVSDNRALCESGGLESTTLTADYVSPDGTTETFPADLQPGYRYVLCWSAGTTAPSANARLRRLALKRTKPSASTPSSTAAEGETSPSTLQLGAEEAAAALNLLKQAGRAESTAAARAAAADNGETSTETGSKWNYLDAFTPKGFRSGLDFRLVQNFDDEVLYIPGSPDLTHAYVAYLGQQDSAGDCESIKQDPLATFKTMFRLQDDSVSFKVGSMTVAGRYPVCLCDSTADECYDVGTASVEESYWKTVAELVYDNRFFMLPCVSRGEPETTEDQTGWSEDRVWLPDGMGVWSFILTTTGSQSLHPMPVLKRTRPTGSKAATWVNFYAKGLRSTVACATDRKQRLYFLGPGRVYMMEPVPGLSPNLSTATGKTFTHSVLKPVDFSIREPYIFFSDYESQVITTINIENPELTHAFYPTDPVMLFSAGVTVLDVDQDYMALCVADTFNHIVGRLNISFETMKTRQTAVKAVPWTSYFGTPKTAQHGINGFSYPFALANYSPQSASAGDLASLLLVTELVSDRLVFLDLKNNGLSFYKQISLSERHLISGLRSIDKTVLLISRAWPPTATSGGMDAYVALLNLQDVGGNLYFTYPDFRSKLQSGLFYSFEPLITGSTIQSFREAPGSDLATMGLTLDSATGVIKGTVSHTGSFNIAVTGGDLLETYTWSISGEAGCRSGEYFDSVKNACELCPVGTFRDQETSLQNCHDIKPYSTTLSPGSTQLAQCRCLPGFEIGNLGDCHPCTSGTYKSSISDTKCTGRCPGNMHSYIQGAESEEALLCLCDAGYYADESGCKPCQQGSYCTGEYDPPKPCPENHTTKAGASKSIGDCVCVAGYTKQGDKCVECDRLSYKGTTGNDACTACPQPAAKGDRGALIASTKLDEAQFTNKPGAKKVSDCVLCASGFFYDVTNGGCTPCRKNYYCPGKNTEPRGCVENATTLREGAESTFDCRCPKGHGGSVARNPLDKAIVCVGCPKNTFQHLDGIMTGCLPCPPFTMTKTTKSTSFSACVARPGFYLSSRLADIMRGFAGARALDGVVGEDLDEEEESKSNVTVMSASSPTLESVRQAETKYENMSDEDLLEVPRVCQHGTEIVKLLLPEIKMQKYTSSFEQCIVACARNVYCTSLTYTNGGSDVPAMTATVTNHTGTFIIAYSICELHMYGPDIDAVTAASITDRFTGTTVPASMTVSCALRRPQSDTVWRAVTYEECPANAYCPGSDEAQIYQCPSSSVTIATRASTAEHCKCIPGYYLSGRQCEPCKMGTYKNTTDNAACTDCPAGFTTGNMASISAYDCACIPGLYMIANPDTDTNDEALAPPSDGTNSAGGEPGETEPKPDADGSESDTGGEPAAEHPGRAEPVPNASAGEAADSEAEGGSGTEPVSAVQLLGGRLVRGDRGELQKALKASQDFASIRSAFQRGDAIGEEQGLSFYQTSKAAWLAPDIRHELEKVVSLHQCVSCYKHMYCPGLWMDPPMNQTHMPPQLCPEGSAVPLSTALSDSVEKCLCLSGYASVGTSVGGAGDASVAFGCVKCASGTYKELQENAPCAGRCMRDAETIEGAVAKVQCFCKIGKYAIVAEDSEAIITCQDCIPGGVCPGGLKTLARQAVEEDHNFVQITIYDHQVPFPSNGFYAVYKPLNQTVWDPSMVPMVPSFTGDTFEEFTSGVSESASENDSETAGGLDLVDESTEGSDETSGVVSPESAGGQGGELSEISGAVSTLQVRTRENTEAVHRYDRIPDIHPCVDDVRCRGGSHNSCVEGSAGYLCSACEDGYSQIRYKSGCYACLALWLDSLLFILMRLVVCAIIWVITALSNIAVQQQACIHPVLIRIAMSHMFFLSVYGLMPATSQSELSSWASIYRVFFFDFYFSTHPYSKVSCFFRHLGIVLSDTHQWYWQRFFQIFVPFFDAVFLTVLGALCVAAYKVVYSGYIARVRVVLQEAREAHGDDIWTERTIRKIESERCLGMFRYISTTSSPFESFVRLLTDLVPAYTALWLWHFPSFVVECTMLMGCVETRYKMEDPIKVLAAFPVQVCSLEDPYFLAGLSLGGVGLLVWGVGSIAGFVAYMSRDHSSDTIDQRFKHGFLVNGYQYEYRWWEGLIGLRKTCVALIMTMYVHTNSSGAQEIFRNSANLALTVLSTALQLQLEPFDKRSHNMANRMEFYGLMVNIVIGIIIQGSYYFDAFKYMGGAPLAVATFYYLYVLWSLFVEWGRMVMMRPYLVSIPSFWRYYNRVTRSLARLYTSGNAKIYYNYITKDMVLEAATKSRVFHLRRLLLRRKKTSYRKINYENRTYFVAALSDSLSQLVIAWCQFTIPGDWLDFTIRYAFCYCFWQRYQDTRSLRVPLDLEEFEAVKPTLFSDWYYDSEKHDQQGDGELDFGMEFLDGADITFNTAEQDFLDLMLDDDVYDDSPITLMELYVAVQSMQHVPQRQLRRLHMAYRERMTQAADSTAPQLRKENHALEGELEELNRALQEMAGADDKIPDLTFSPLDFFFTVEMVNQAQHEIERLRGLIESEIDDIARARAAQAVAVHLELSLNENADVDELLETMAFEEQTAKEEAAARIAYVDESKKRIQKKKAALAGRRPHLALAAKRPPLNLEDKRRLRLGPAAEAGPAAQRKIGLVVPGAAPVAAKRRISRHTVDMHRTLQGVAEGAAPVGVLRPDRQVPRGASGDQLEGTRRTIRLGPGPSTDSPYGNKRTLRRDMTGSSSDVGGEPATEPKRVARTVSPLRSRDASVGESAEGDAEKAEPPTSSSGAVGTVRSVLRPEPPGPTESPLRRDSELSASPSPSSSPSPEPREKQGPELAGRRRLGPLGGSRPPPQDAEAPPPAASSSPLAAQPKGQGLPLGKRQLKRPGNAKQD
ncbi:hypothetical protein NCLIV_012890 [Neospora caninum Liverpool]|uniref:Signal peptide, CUB and EGF-like domain-containing protein 3 n=1 Tax=Neospora caninum (strain Liverpool) TaxID=572307 RepID=F0VCY0_NEOCL|nr:hypothetical protein NCLIV_012890 [Neospora caninum Liverpool]CBZ51495.1 hypothetical protein NCLIV_012890 [Neospora caninum Liverpool]CEL65445.1 TPA: Signal peptide, CUB and EGF-like domain-containing protein 3 [Neospora caninum Liverpool]|eukprot:XP_003881528.1 hypothetical protein NCLIV_012890 [Neospora caninum Liverpool]